MLRGQLWLLKYHLSGMCGNPLSHLLTTPAPPPSLATHPHSTTLLPHPGTQHMSLDTLYCTAYCSKHTLLYWPAHCSRNMLLYCNAHCTSQNPNCQTAQGAFPSVRCQMAVNRHQTAIIGHSPIDRAGRHHISYTEPAWRVSLKVLQITPNLWSFNLHWLYPGTRKIPARNNLPALCPMSLE